ncbi:uncharacterized protein [Physcomitrium patens]|uniref:uncharacterized protein isoform X2 n=1 Tax=Physcomitrium patens TaxID=3218 RepID=UPI000D179A44|nr:receptor-like kinase LIP2 isoform X2 [Physcomitrium patens]|eukprot:XP_024385907.1 receptor-like kinase LIP2 isoform X2 [Physcomitrella patens]
MFRSLSMRVGSQDFEKLPPMVKALIREAWRTWRWAGENAWMLSSMMAMAQLSEDVGLYSSDSGIDFNKSPSWSQEPDDLCGKIRGGNQGTLVFRGRGMDNISSLLSWFMIFVVGVTTGLFWRATQKLEKSAVTSSSKDIVELEPNMPPSSSSTTLTSNSPRFLRSSTVGAVRAYTLKEMEEMTMNFSKEIGRGGQGVVYFAKSLADELIQRPLAVKRLQNGSNVLLHNVENRSQEVVEKEFWAELSTISRLHHRNLVALLGYCIEGDDLFLVYEYMGAGSLDQYLHIKSKLEPGNGGMVLSWKARMQCAAEVAQGLEYLHSHASPSLVHRDVKSGNILFDEEMHAKLADFGLSKPLPSDHPVTVSTRVRGTHGYVDPVYLHNGTPCDKNDVYSYGVVLLELITGRRAIHQGISLVNWCKDSFFQPDPVIMRHNVRNMVDMCIFRNEYSEEQLHEVVKVAQACVQDRQEDRPSMKDVVVWLHNANGKEVSSSECSSLDTTLDMTSLMSNGSGLSSLTSISHRQLLLRPLPPPQLPTVPSLPIQTSNWLSSYDIIDNTILVRCTVRNNQKIALRCKIWPTPKNFGLNKIEATLNGAFLWKKGLWWYNAKSSREFTVDDDMKLIAEWHVTLRTPPIISRHPLPSHDPRRHQGPFCVEYLALKDEFGRVLIEYEGDRSPLPESLATKRKIPSKTGQYWRDSDRDRDRDHPWTTNTDLTQSEGELSGA